MLAENENYFTKIRVFFTLVKPKIDLVCIDHCDYAQCGLTTLKLPEMMRGFRTEDIETRPT